MYQDQAAGEGRPHQGAGNIQELVNFPAESLEEDSDPEWPVFRWTETTRRRKYQIENPFPKLKLKKSYEAFLIGKGFYKPTQARSRKRETTVDRNMFPI